MGNGFYVTHYSNDRTSLEFQGPLLDGGPEYYGIMWLLFEQLMDSDTHRLRWNQLRAIAHQCFTTPAKITEFVYSAVENGLFQKDDNEFWCDEINKRIASSLDAMPMKKRVRPSEQRQVRRDSHGYSEDFEKFWSAYPRREDKMNAFRQFEANRIAGASLDELLTSASNYAKSRIGQDPKYTLLPSTFLGQGERWKEFRAITAKREPTTVGAIRDQKKRCPVCDAVEPEGNMASCPKCGFNLFESGDPAKVAEYKKDYEEGNFVSFNPGSLASMLKNRTASAIPF